MARQSTFWAIAALALGMVVAAAFIFRNNAPAEPAPSGASGAKLQIVAAENFWGSLASQIGGSRVRVFSVVSDPNADPHEYESSATDARAVAAANYVIENGAGYDSWMGKLLGAGSGQGRTVLDVASFLGKKEGDNPHFWYDPDYVNMVAAKIEEDLASLDPAGAPYYASQYKALQSSLAGYENGIAQIKQRFGGAKVAATEDIFTYLAGASGLDLVSPPAFIEAVAEGNDPPAASVVQFEDQLNSGEVRLMVYNEQTVTPLTDNMKKLAAERNIPIVGITETIQPPSASFEEWMGGEVADLQNALSAGTSGK